MTEAFAARARLAASAAAAARACGRRSRGRESGAASQAREGDEAAAATELRPPTRTLLSGQKRQPRFVNRRVVNRRSSVNRG